MQEKNRSYLKSVLNSDAVLFLKKFWREPSQIGALFPSSPDLCQEAAKYWKKPALRCLEVGTGTGSVTSFLADRMEQEQTLDLVEIDEEFCDRLKVKYKERSNIHVFHRSVLDWTPPEKYDVIISSLPLNAFDRQFVENILLHYHKILKPGGVFTYYQYAGLPQIKMWFLTKDSREEFGKTRQLLGKFCEDFEFESKMIWANIPPAIVHHCRF